MKKWLLFVLKLLTGLALTYAGGLLIVMGNNFSGFYKIPAMVLLFLAMLNFASIIWQD